MPDRRRLLVSGDSENPNGGAENRRVGDAEIGGAIERFGQKRARHGEHFKQVVVPFAAPDIKKHRPRGVGRVGAVDSPAAKPPQQKRIDGAESEIAVGGAAGEGFVAAEHPRDFSGGKIRIEKQPAFFVGGGLESVGAHLAADVGGAAVLPNNRAPDGLAARALPQQSRLALIGDADGGDVGGARAGFGYRFAGGGEERFPDVFRIVLDPARARKMLRELALREGDRAQIGIEQNRPRRSRALIERENKRRFHCFGRRLP